MLYYEGCVPELKITNTNCSEARADAISPCHNKDYKTFPFCRCLSLIRWCLWSDRLLFCMCTCASYCIVCLSVQLDALTSTFNRYRRIRKTQRLCMRDVSRVYGGGGSNTCAARTLRPQHTSHHCRTLVQLIERNTIGGNQCLAACLRAAAVAHGCINMQQGSV